MTQSKIKILCYVRLLLYSYDKKVKSAYGFITVWNIFNIRGTKIYDVFIAHEYIKKVHCKTL